MDEEWDLERQQKEHGTASTANPTEMEYEPS